ncbi:putative membrane protein [Bradyrhizobium sp. LB7.2]
MTALALQRPRITLISLSIEAIALGVYLVRDAFGGVIRYYTSILHLDTLWYLPDAVALLCLVQFFVHCILRNRSTLALLVFAQIMLSLVLGYFMMGTATAAISSFKMMLPVFVGFCFCSIQASVPTESCCR